MVDAKDILFQQYDGRTLLDINDGGYIAIANGATGPGQLRLYEDTDNGTNFTALQVGTQSGDITYTLPTADGSSGTRLTTNGSGTLSWADTSVPTSANGQALGSTSAEWSDLYLADGGVIYLGADQDTTLTHVADTGILLNSTRQLQFGDSGTYIHQSADGVLDLVSDTEIEINATTIDINGAVQISGTTTIAGNLVFGSATVTEAQLEILDGATVTTTELNIMDGGTSATSTTVADADRVVFNDGGTMKQVAVTDLAAYFDDEITSMPNLTTAAALVTVSALDTGSITSGFGNIDNGASNITSGGLVKLDVDADADDVTGDSATGRLTLGAGEDLNLYHGGTNSYIVNDTGDLILKTGASDEDMIFQGNDGGAAITALTLDMSAAGAAAFNSTVTATGFIIGSANIAEAELEMIDGITAGTVIASKAIVTDSDKDITGGRNITVSGVITGGTVEATTDTAAGDNAAMGYTAAEGLILTGQGSTSDITLKNDADVVVFTVPTGTDDILFPDGGKILMGAGSDLQLYHDGSHSYIEDQGTGDLLIRGNGLKLRSPTDEDFIVCTTNGSVDLYHDDTKKFETTAAGVTITGDVQLSSHLDMPDNAIIKLGTGDDLHIYHDGSHSYVADQGTGNLRLAGSVVEIMMGGDYGETALKATDNGSVELYHDNTKKFETTAAGITVSGTAIATTDTDTSNTGNVTLDFAANQNFVLTLTGNTTLVNPTTEQVGQSGFIAFIQDGTGSRTVSLGTDYETAASAGLTLTATAAATDLVPYLVVAAGRVLLGTPQLAFG